ncbi:hypothetical protein V1477_018755 [Vespula maculifrons]|uniref:Uncharacterized protein n=2 Tax=Vespula TaxID=7451 RepID=A0A834NVJ5_VESGE|nr:hypothetical protein HZH68_001421 [Vespula germanica]
MSCSVDPSLEFLLCYFSLGSFALRKTVLKEMEGRRMGGSGMGKVLLATLDVLLARVLVARDSSHRGEILVFSSRNAWQMLVGETKVEKSWKSGRKYAGISPGKSTPNYTSDKCSTMETKVCLKPRTVAVLSRVRSEYARFLLVY